LVALGAFGLGAVALVAFVAYDRAIGRDARDLANVRAAARKAGIPVDPSSFESRVRVDEDAGPDYRTAVALVNSLSAGKRNTLLQAITNAGNGWRFPGDAELTRTMLRDWTRVIAALEVATSKPAARFDRDWTLPLTVALDDYNAMRALHALLCARAYEEAEAGRFASAYADLGRARRMVGHMAKEPGLVPAYVSTQLEMRGWRAFRLILRMTPFDQVEHAETLLAEWPEPANPETALRASLGMLALAVRSLGIEGQAIALRERERGNLPPAIAWAVDSPAARRALETRILRRALLVLRDDRSAETFNKHKRQADRSADDVVLGLPTLFEFADAAFEGNRRCLAAHRLATVSLAAIAHRRRTGSYPATVEAPLDPFSERPLVYRRDGDGFLVYSVDIDRNDDGGAESQDARRNRGARDLVWRYR
jgi:hypothetical protein